MSRFDFNLIRVLSKQGVRQRRHLSGLRKKGPSVVKKISLESRYEKSYHIFTLFSYSFCVTFAYKVIRHVHNFFWSHCMMIIHWLVRLLLKWQKWPKWQFGVVVWPLWSFWFQTTVSFGGRPLPKSKMIIPSHSSIFIYLNNYMSLYFMLLGGTSILSHTRGGGTATSLYPLPMGQQNGGIQQLVFRYESLLPCQTLSLCWPSSGSS